MARIPITMGSGTLQKPSSIVGIDLGTTHSLIAMVDRHTGQPFIIKNKGERALVPSVLYFSREGEVMVGDAAKDKLLTEPERGIFSAKRLMGKSYQDLVGEVPYLSYTILEQPGSDLVKVQVADTYYSPIELSAFILKDLKARAEAVLQRPISQAVITVPAYFNDTQRQATRDAGKLAGIDVLRILNEPTAAALAYGMHQRETTDTTLAVYDLGGGTFDISILKMVDGVFEVLATHGDTHLGGDDIDKAIVAHWEKVHGLQNVRALRPIAEQAKKALGSAPTFTHAWGNITLSLQQQELADLVAPLLDRTLAAARAALKDAKLDVTHIDRVLLVGGATRMPLVKRAVNAFFNKTADDSMDPDEVVALGAAVQADILAGNNSELLLLDVTPLSLGIETMGGLMDVLIPRNTKIPTQAKRMYTTQQDGQSGVTVSVYQGERDLVQDNRMLSTFTLKGIPAMPAGLPKVEICFTMDADGILSVAAVEQRSQTAQAITITPRHGLDEATINEMLQHSLAHAQEDVAKRALIEARMEGERLHAITKTFLEKHISYITHTERETSLQALSVLSQALTGSDKNAIQAAIAEVNRVTEAYAERVLNLSLQEAVQRK